ncbi:MAG: ribosomal protein S18-alanine N-acetyltransferase [Gemmatimonadaceae bacterium]
MDELSPRAEAAAVTASDPEPGRSPPSSPAPRVPPRSVAARDLQVRTAHAADVARIAAIEVASFSDPWSARSFMSSLQRPEVRMTVAESRLEGQSAVVAGYLVAWFVAGEGEIANIAVHPDWRRRGVGTALLDDILSAARAADVHAMYLEVRASNSAAQALYASRGFLPVGRRRRYYVDPVEDALLLRWEDAPPAL